MRVKIIGPWLEESGEIGNVIKTYKASCCSNPECPVQAYDIILDSGMKLEDVYEDEIEAISDLSNVNWNEVANALKGE